NDANLTRFIEKPWADDVLHRAVEAILGGARNRSAKSKPGYLDQNPDRHLQRLEEESPGITYVDFADDGGIIIDEDDGLD
ncbi:MAG: hypothetical protein ABI866_03540, partial [Dokdonella sp.]